MVPTDLPGLCLSSSEEQESKVLYSNPFDKRGLQSDVELLQSLQHSNQRVH